MFLSFAILIEFNVKKLTIGGWEGHTCIHLELILYLPFNTLEQLFFQAS